MDYRDLEELRILEAMKGDELAIASLQENQSRNSKYGVKANYQFTLTPVVGYICPPRKQEGLTLAGNQERISGNMTAFLNVAAGFNYKDLNSHTYLMVNQQNFYEMTFSYLVKEFNVELYRIYELQETTDSKKAFENFKRSF